MRQIANCLCYAAFVVLIHSAPLFSAETNVQSSPQNLIECSKEELMIYFPKAIVKSVLSKANLSQEQIDDIAQDLSQKDPEIRKIVEEKAAKLNPNPFRDLNQRDLAIKIYLETLFEEFATVLKAHGITNKEQIQTLLDEIRTTKSKQFIECIRKQQQKAISTPPPPST